MTGNALKEFSRIADYDKDLAPLQEALVEIDSLLVTSVVICPLIWIVLLLTKKLFLKQKKDWIWSIV